MAPLVLLKKKKKENNIFKQLKHKNIQLIFVLQYMHGRNGWWMDVEEFIRSANL